jgi:hypothetical protein
MKERPILFSAQMVRAILHGCKTQTRLVMKPQPKVSESGWFSWDGHAPNSQYGAYAANHIDKESLRLFVGPSCPYGKPGDRLWVRETWMPDPSCDDDAWDDAAISWHEWDGCGMPMRDYPDALKNASNVIYRASWDGQEIVGWKPSIHMPRWASRINLEITGVRVERLNAISESDAKNEGAPSYDEGVDAPPPNDDEYTWSYVASFQRLWDSINGAGSWQANPWVWVVEFKVLK